MSESAGVDVARAPVRAPRAGRDLPIAIGVGVALLVVTGGSLILFASLMAVLGLWYWSQGSVSVETVTTPSTGPPSRFLRRWGLRSAIG